MHSFHVVESSKGKIHHMLNRQAYVWTLAPVFAVMIPRAKYLCFGSLDVPGSSTKIGCRCQLYRACDWIEAALERRESAKFSIYPADMEAQEEGWSSGSPGRSLLCDPAGELVCCRRMCWPGVLKESCTVH